MIYRVKDYGADAEGKRLNTEIVQRLVNLCFENGGGKIVFDGGRYELSTIFLKSNMHIEIAADAEILGAESYYDYAQEEKVSYPIYLD